MNTLCKRLISGLTAFSFALVTLVMPVSADLYFPPDFRDTISDGVQSMLNFNLDDMINYVNEYRTNHPDTTILEAYEHYKNSDANGHHGGGGEGGHRDSDIIDKTFHYNEVTKHSVDFIGTQSENEYISYDGNVRIWTEFDHKGGTADYYNIYVESMGQVKKVSKMPYSCRQKSTDPSPPFTWYMQGTVFHYDFYEMGYFPNASGGTTYAYGQKHESFDIGSYIIFPDTDNSNYYTVFDNSGQSWHYDPISNNYFDNSNIFIPFIDLDLKQFPEDDFNDFFNELQNINYNSAFQFMSLYNMLQSILNSLQGLEGSDGTVIDLSQIKIDIPLNDYTSLLQAIQIALVTMSNNLTSLSSHADCLQLIDLLTKLYNNSLVELSDLSVVNQHMRDIIARLDVIIELQDIAITQDVLDDISDNEMQTITTYLTFVTTLLNLYPLSFVSSAIDSTQAIVFNTNSPPDLTINIRGNDYILLSSSIVGKFSGALSIARGFVSVLVLYAWLVYMRRKISDTL